MYHNIVVEKREKETIFYTGNYVYTGIKIERDVTDIYKREDR